MCFEFVYPLTFSYNDGTTVIVANESELIFILENLSLPLLDASFRWHDGSFYP
jgi:hypothetical protein